MNIKQFIKILEQLEPEHEILFDIKSIESYQDFGTLTGIYEDQDSVILEFK